ncbi:protein lifeguard 4-like [Lytechinus variegatus]|uniref:protein lifeguard 4-like n=1 Tax=Lytechinus variegatus TaxID=7654 RepID=UPI001BB2A313|nr:protein lifeguard 4-like [Lytechinus variegatus]
MSTKIPIEGDSVLEDFYHSTSVMSAHIDIRMNFLRKVFGILSAQLLMTAVVSGIFMYFEGVKNYIQESPGMLMIAFVLSFIFLVALMVKSREYPANMILLACFTLVEAYSVGTVVTFYDKSVVIEALVLTLAVSFSLLVFTVQSRKDFSTWGAGLYAGLMILIVGGLLQLFIPHSDMLELVIAIGGAIIFSLFLIYDIHLIMHKLSPEEYIMASINLYLDLINLFLYILRILNQANKK